MKRLGILLAALVIIAGFNGRAMAGYTYYSSYFTSESGYWTGVGVSNTSSSTIANVSVVVYDTNGTLQTTENHAIAANGTTSFIVGSGLSNVTGWMKISSDVALTGLCFIGTSDSDEYIADIPMAHTLATSLHIPHAPQNTNWDTTVFVCNPNNSSNSFSIAYVDTQGQQVTSVDYTLPAYGSGGYELQDILGQGISYDAGKVVITSNQGVTAFSLFTNIKAGKNGYGGIAAVDTSDQGSGVSECLTTTSVTITVTDAINGSFISGATVSSGSQSSTTDSLGAATLNGLPGDIDVLVNVSANGYVSQPSTVSTVCGESTTESVSLLPEGDTGTLRGDIRIILTWGEDPRDLDSHLSGPNDDGTGFYHIYYADKNNCSSAPCDSNEPAWLDVDDTTSYGPETITIQKVDGQFIEGTYSYYVHHYAGSSNIPESGAVVKIYEGNSLIGTYSPPQTNQSVEEDWVWKVFNITIDSYGYYTLSTISEYFGPTSSSNVFTTSQVTEIDPMGISDEDYELFELLPKKLSRW